MLQKRVIPTLLLKNASLVKTTNFGRYEYIGDPANTVRIFNELEVDELTFLDISATIENREPNYQVLKDIAEESFMPLSYGGGIKNLEQVKKILGLGFEKIVINSSFHSNNNLIEEISKHFGNQSIVGSIDVKCNWLGNNVVYTHSGQKKEKISPIELALKMESAGFGEILITSIDKEGSWTGYDVELIKEIKDAVTIPIIANGGCGAIKDIQMVFNIPGVQAAAVGSLVVFQKKGMGVLVNYPQKEIDIIIQK